MSAIFSRVIIDPSQRAARKALASPEVLHAIVERASGDPESSRALWRLDRGIGRHVLFIVSPRKPDAALLAEQLGSALTEISSFSYDRFLASISAGQEWQFRLRANPTKALRQEGARSKRVALIKENDQIAWLIRRGEQRGGFEIPQNRLAVPEVVIQTRGADEFRRRDATVTLGTVVYDGILRVTEPDALRAVLVGGLGHGKAYGCGLLTLAPPPRQG